MAATARRFGDTTVTDAPRRRASSTPVPAPWVAACGTRHDRVDRRGKVAEAGDLITWSLRIVAYSAEVSGVGLTRVARLHLTEHIDPCPPVPPPVLRRAHSGFIDQRLQQLTHRSWQNGAPRIGRWNRVRRNLPATLALGILSLELIVHGWDFAVALDRPIDMSDVHATQVLGLAHQTLTAQSRATAGFNLPVPVPANAGALERSSRSPAATECR